MPVLRHPPIQQNALPKSVVSIALRPWRQSLAIKIEQRVQPMAQRSIPSAYPCNAIFLQCDFDTIGTTSITSDIETVLVIHDLLCSLGFERFTIRVNNRLVLNGLLEKLGLAEQSTAVLRGLDKLAKIDPEAVAQELARTSGATADQIEKVLQLANLSKEKSNVLQQVETLVAGNEIGMEGVAHLAELSEAVAAAGTCRSLADWTTTPAW